MNWWDTDETVSSPAVGPAGGQPAAAGMAATKWWEQDEPAAPSNASQLPPDRLQMNQGTGPRVAIGKTAGERAVEGMGMMERVARGAVGGTEDLGLGAAQLGNDALAFVGVPGADERAEGLRREAMDMAQRKKPLYDTTEGTVGQVLPSLMVPGSTIPRAVAGGVAYGLTQPVTQEGERGQNALESGAVFGAGNAVARGVGGLVNRVRSPARGGRQPTPQEAQRAIEVKEAEDLGLKVSVGGRTGGRFAKGLESVFEDLPVTSSRQKKFREGNQAQANQRLAEQFGSPDAQLLNRDVITTAKARVGAEFDKYVQANTPIDVDGRFMIAMKDIQRQAELLPEARRSPELKSILKNYYENIESVWRRGNVKIDGERYKAMREDLTETARRLFKEGGEKTAMRIGKAVDALDAMAGRSVPAELQASYKTARQQWMALRIAEDAVDESGNVVRGKLNQAIRRHAPKQGTGQDPYRRLSRSMKVSGESTPNSGTPLRGLAMASMAAPAVALTGIPGIGGDTSMVDVAQGVSVPLAIQAMMMNPWTARRITRQLAPTGPVGNSLMELLRRGSGVGSYGVLQEQAGQ